MKNTLAFLTLNLWVLCLNGCHPAGQRDMSDSDASAVAATDSVAASPPSVAPAMTAQPPGGNRITCGGIGEVGFNLTENELIAKFGRKNVRRDSIFAESEFAGLRTLVYPDTPREVMVDWQEEKPPFRTVQRLGLRHESSVYRFANSIGIGTTAAELVERNGGTPITFGGMGWDYGGGFSGFDAGKLKAEMPCFSAGFELIDVAPDIEALLGEKQIKSDTLTKVQLNAVSIIEIYINRHQ